MSETAEISKTYQPAAAEEKWYQYWLDHKFFAAHPNPAKKPYTIVIPPPNVTGVLHMGHMLNNTIQDILIRRARMQGFEACWVPGTDHASIATEAKVVNMLREKGISKKDISRSEFLEYAWEWKEKYGGIILEQLKKLGASCDWDRTRFTMEESLSEAVIDVFIDLYRKGHIYRAYRMVNWDPKGKTALSDEEIIHKDVQSKLFYVKYEVVGSYEEFQLIDNHVFVYNVKSITDEAQKVKFRNSKLKGFATSDIFISINNKQVRLIDLEVEKDGMAQKLGELELEVWTAQPTNKFIDFAHQNGFDCKIIGTNLKLSDLLKLTCSATNYLTVATTRPETIMADTAICVNPADERYMHLHGKMVHVPLLNRQIPVITDEYVAMDFGTGCLKVTPAHDINDYALGIKHHLEIIDILNEDGTLNEKCGIPAYIGKDRFMVRKLIGKDLEEAGLLEKTEEYKSSVGYSERNADTVVEPRLSMQWWLKMETLAKPALDNVMNDTIHFYPDRFKNMYRSWMENVRDWCISRQLWWGQQIPAFYTPDGEMIVAKTREEALHIANQAIEKNNSRADFEYNNGHFAPTEPKSYLLLEDLRQDEDVLDTWFSSWLWPISVFDGFENPDNADINYFYPTNTLVTAPDIIFFWVARMIISGYEYRHEKPFQDVYFTGIIRDMYGRKMSKQLGNSPDPVALMERYGADGVRTGMLFSSPAGNDLIFDTPVPKSNKAEDVAAFFSNPKNDPLASKLCEQGRNFCNKIWNAFRLINDWKQGADSVAQPQVNVLAIHWFEHRFREAFAEIEDHFSKFRMSDALLKVYNLVWTDFCAWYLEMVKPEYQQSLDKATLEATLAFFDRLMRLVHPFMPFITEELWQQLQERQEGESICIAPFPEIQAFDNQVVDNGSLMQELISQIRNTKNSKGISPKVGVPLLIKTQNQPLYEAWSGLICKLAGVSDISFTDGKATESIGFMIRTDEFFIPLAQELDIEAEIEKTKTELAYQQGFLETVLTRLGNEKFVSKAKPEIVETERRKQADAEDKIKSLTERLDMLAKKS